MVLKSLKLLLRQARITAGDIILPFSIQGKSDLRAVYDPIRFQTHSPFLPEFRSVSCCGVKPDAFSGLFSLVAVSMLSNLSRHTLGLDGNSFSLDFLSVATFGFCSESVILNHTCSSLTIYRFGKGSGDREEHTRMNRGQK